MTLDWRQHSRPPSVHHESWLAQTLQLQRTPCPASCIPHPVLRQHASPEPPVLANLEKLHHKAVRAEVNDGSVRRTSPDFATTCALQLQVAPGTDTCPSGVLRVWLVPVCSEHKAHMTHSQHFRWQYLVMATTGTEGDVATDLSSHVARAAHSFASARHRPNCEHRGCPVSANNVRIGNRPCTRASNVNLKL